MAGDVGAEKLKEGTRGRDGVDHSILKKKKKKENDDDDDLNRNENET